VIRVYLDNNLPIRLKAALSSGFAVLHARDVGWQGVLNGELLDRTEAEFDVLLTMDQNMPFQTNILGRKLAGLVVEAKSNRFSEIEPLIDSIASAIPRLKEGRFFVISESGIREI